MGKYITLRVTPSLKASGSRTSPRTWESNSASTAPWMPGLALANAISEDGGIPGLDALAGDAATWKPTGTYRYQMTKMISKMKHSVLSTP